MEKIIKRSSGDETITLDKGWETEDGAYFNIEKIVIEMSAKTKLSLVNAQQLCGLNDDIWSIQIKARDSVRYYDEDGIETTVYRTDVVYYCVMSEFIVFHSQSKHNSQAQIESEIFNIK